MPIQFGPQFWGAVKLARELTPGSDSEAISRAIQSRFPGLAEESRLEAMTRGLAAEAMAGHIQGVSTDDAIAAEMERRGSLGFLQAVVVDALVQVERPQPDQFGRPQYAPKTARVVVTPGMTEQDILMQIQAMMERWQKESGVDAGYVDVLFWHVY